MSFGIIAENVFTGYRILRKVLDTLKVMGGGLMVKEDSSEPYKSCV